MAESFGKSFTLVEVTPDDALAGTQYWIAAAKAHQALTLVLAAVPEGWTGDVIELTEEQRSSLEKLNLKPGEVYRVMKK